MRPEQVASPIHQQTPHASTECETPATETATWQTTQTTNIGANEFSSVDKDEQHRPSQAKDVTAQNPTNKETQTKID